MHTPIVPMIVKLFDPLVSGQAWRGLEAVLDEIEQVEDFFFIQIGANDGVVHDPLYKRVLRNNWRGILIEPVRFYFDRLKRNYGEGGGSDLIFENIAISARDETRDFFRIREGLDFLPQWTKGLGSFNRAVLMKHRWVIPDIGRYIVQEKVECLSFTSLLERHDVEKVNLLAIDTEGYDYEIIRRINFDRVRPGVVLYEHKHLSRVDRRDCERLLEKNGYRFRRNFSNTLAYS